MQSASEPTSQIETPVPCADCGYNLAGLANDGACPECSRSIRESRIAHAKTLIMREGRSRRSLGFKLLIVGAGLSLVMMVLGPIYAFVVGLGRGGPIWMLPFFIPPPLVLAGTWMATSLPKSSLEIANSNSRLIARFLSVAVLVLFALPFVVLLFGSSKYSPYESLRTTVLSVIYFAYPVLSLITAFLVYQWRAQWR